MGGHKFSWSSLTDPWVYTHAAATSIAGSTRKFKHGKCKASYGVENPASLSPKDVVLAIPHELIGTDNQICTTRQETNPAEPKTEAPKKREAEKKGLDTCKN